VVPVDLEIVGVYQTPENMPGPDLFLPLHVAQESVGYTDNNIMGICLRLKDPHAPDNIEQVMGELITQYSASAQQQEDSADSDMPPPVEEVDYSTLEAETTAETAATAEEIVVPDVAEPTEPEAEYIQPRNPTMWSITPWTDALQSLYKLIANERVMMSFVLSSITLVASFCIMAVMFTMSLQRKREIAVLQALGATPRKIVGIFAWQGVIIGFLGAVLGVLLSLLVLYYRHEIQGALAGIGMDPFPMEAHGISLPAVYRPEIFIKQAIVAFIMVTIASIIPALFVSRQDPAKALRSN
jgi:ABC-type lipoprotein release transport system permease subunit